MHSIRPFVLLTLPLVACEAVAPLLPGELGSEAPWECEPPGESALEGHPIMAEPCLSGCEDEEPVEDSGEDSGEVACETTDPEVPAGFVPPEGWYLELFSQGHDTPGALRAPASGEVYLGAGAGTWDARAVKRLAADGSGTESDPISDPDGIAVDSSGAVFAAGSNRIVRVGSLDGGTDSTWHSLSSGGNINGLVVDTERGDVFYVPLNAGQVIRVEQDGSETQLMGSGDEASIALDADGDIWVFQRNVGAIYRVDRESLAVTLELEITSLEPGWARTNRVTVGPDGLIYFTSYVIDEGASISRWDPAAPDVVERWIDGIQSEENNPDDLEFSDADGCLYWSCPLTGNIWRACAC